jgi:outer membrane protein assembly factor BamD
MGDPTLADPKPTLAPQVYKQILADFNNAMNPAAPATTAPAGNAAAATNAPAAPAPTTTVPAAPLAFGEVPTAADAAGSSGSSATVAAPAARSTGGATTSLGVEVVPNSSATPTSTAYPTSVPDNGGLSPVGPKDATPLPAAEKPAVAPNAVNDIPAGAAPPAQTPNPNGKNGKPAMDKKDESSSKHKPKKGLGKLNPF